MSSAASIPSATWRMLAGRGGGKPLPKGIDAAWDSATGLAKRLTTRTARFIREAEEVVACAGQFTQMSDAKLHQTAEEFRDLFRCGRDEHEDLVRAFALYAKSPFASLGSASSLVQAAGALAIEAGCIAEMATGEGKTLTATMPATVGGWRGKGCHVITVNDYLAKRDAEWMNSVYKFCGLNAVYIEGGMPPQQRKAAYDADITYCTNKEVAADFLRDRLALGRLGGVPQALLARIVDGSGSGTDRLVQRGLHYAIVDEADSVLIDEAVTPLIISGEAPNREQVEAFTRAAQIAGSLTPKVHYRANARYREIDLTDAGKERITELAGGFGGVWRGARRREELTNQALTAAEFYVNGKQYVIQDGKVVIVDEFTGRLMPDREWRDGLHQAVSAKEGMEVQAPKDTYARISFQRFFRLYRRLSGMTGTADEAWREFWQIYHMPTVVIPTNRPCIRKHLPDKVFATESGKWRAIVDDIRKAHNAGQPVLVGTRSVKSSEHLSGLLAAAGLEHQVLNAVRHAEEAQIVAVAGQEGKITVATNMAGRGTDIKLGRGGAEKGGLYVIATERHEAGRVDRQLFGRSGRQGDPGVAQAVVSIEDELLKRHTPHVSAYLCRRHGQTDHEISGRLERFVLEHAQRKAERMALRQRKGVLRTDDWLDEYLGFAGSER